MKLITSIALLMSLTLFGTHAIADVVDLQSYNNIYHVDANGSDANDGSQGNPFATVNQAILTANSGDVIVIGEGSFDITNTGWSGNQYTGLNNAGKDIDFVGTNGGTTLTIDGAQSATRDVAFYSGTGFSRIYGVKFIRDSNGRSTNYMNAIFGYGTVNGEFYNSVFKAVNYGAAGMTYANVGTMNVSVYNSVFDVESDFVNSYSGNADGLRIVDSVSNYGFAESDTRVAYTNVLGNVEFDENYVITSDVGGQQNLGIHAGDYPWGEINDVSAPFALSLFGFAGLALARRRQ